MKKRTLGESQFAAQKAESQTRNKYEGLHTHDKQDEI